MFWLNFAITELTRVYTSIFCFADGGMYVLNATTGLNSRELAEYYASLLADHPAISCLVDPFAVHVRRVCYIEFVVVWWKSPLDIAVDLRFCYKLWWWDCRTVWKEVAWQAWWRPAARGAKFSDEIRHPAPGITAVWKFRRKRWCLS